MKIKEDMIKVVSMEKDTRNLGLWGKDKWSMKPKEKIRQLSIMGKMMDKEIRAR